MLALHDFQNLNILRATIRIWISDKNCSLQLISSAQGGQNFSYPKKPFAKINILEDDISIFFA